MALPAELVDDIILRLPVKSLLRFRCVSKPWLALIDSSDFIKLHLNRSIQTRNNRILMVSDESPTTYPRITSFNVDSPGIPVESDHPLKNSYKKRDERNWVKASCNGLVLITYHGINDYDDTNFIWNPSTRNYHRLPFAEFDSHVVVEDDDDHGHDDGVFIETVEYGIGYDSVHDDYKVVRMILFDRESDGTYVTEVKVYNLKSNTWRRIRDFPYYFYLYSCHGVLSCGALHWLVCEDYRGDDPYIAAFDLATEEYRLVPMPPNIEKFDMCGERVGVLEGCLIICNRLRDRIDVWVMKRYGVKESWTKLISVGLLQHEYVYDNFITPLALSKDGAEVLFMHSSRMLLWVDLQRKVAMIFDVHGLPKSFMSVFVVESLVPLK